MIAISGFKFFNIDFLWEKGEEEEGIKFRIKKKSYYFWLIEIKKIKNKKIKFEPRSFFILENKIKQIIHSSHASIGAI